MCWSQDEIDNNIAAHLRQQIEDARDAYAALQAKYDQLAAFARDNAGASSRPRRV